MKTLYHYTNLERAQKIIDDGAIFALTPGLGPDDPRAVWLTTDGEPKHLHTMTQDEQRVRFTVRVPAPDVSKLRDWVLRRGGTAQQARQMMRGNSAVAYTWRVLERPVTWPRWVEVLDLQTGEHLWTPTGRRTA